MTAGNTQNRIRTEGLVELGASVARAAQVPFDLEAARASIREAVNNGAGANKSFTLMAQATAITPTPIETPLYTIPQLVGPQQPVVLCGTDRVVAVLKVDGGKVHIISSESPEHHWVSLSDLGLMVGATDEEAEVSALALDAAMPMDPISFPGSKPGDVKIALRRLWALLSSEKKDIQAIILYALGAGIFTLAIPVAVQTIVNTVAFGTLLQPLLITTTLLVGGLSLFGVLTALEVYIVELLQRRIVARVVGDLAYRMPRATAAALDKVYGPEQLNRFFDVFTIHKATAQLLIDGLDIALRALIGLLLLAFYHPILLAFDVLLIIALIAVLFVLGRGGVKTAIIESKKKYRLAGWLEELGRSPKLFKSPSASVMARDRTDAHLRDFLVTRAQHFRVVMRQTIGALAVYALASGALLGLGGWLVMSGQLTLGQLVASELVLTSVVTAFAKVGKHVESFYDLVAGVDKVGALIDLPIENPGPMSEPPPPASHGSELTIENVSMALGGCKVIQGMSTSIQAGERVSVLGGSGSGKTTFADLLYGLRSPSSGCVRVDGIHIDDMALRHLRSRVAVARPEDVVLGTILDNVRLGDASISEDRARRALEMVNLSDVVNQLEDGLHTALFPGGRPLTESQAARLSMARAIAARPSILIVDGLFDPQDESVRAEILGRLTDPEAPWTLLVLTRMETVARPLPRSLELHNGQTVDLPVHRGA